MPPPPPAAAEWAAFEAGPAPTSSPAAGAPPLPPPPAKADAAAFAKSFVRLRDVAGDAYIDPASLKVVRRLGIGGFATVELCELRRTATKNGNGSNGAVAVAATTTADASSAYPPRPRSPPLLFGGHAHHPLSSTPDDPSSTTTPLVAVKRLHPHLFATPKELDAFTGEIRLLRQLNHRHIVQFVGCGGLESAKAAYIVQEYVGGGSLGQLIARQCMQGGGGEQVGAAATPKGDPTGATFRRRSAGMFASLFTSQAVYQAGDAVDIMLQVARALEYLHTRTPMVLHRDIKPDNVLLAAPLPTAAAAARRRRRLAIEATRQGSGGLSADAVAAALGNVSTAAGAAELAAAGSAPPSALDEVADAAVVAAAAGGGSAPAAVQRSAGSLTAPSAARPPPRRMPSFSGMSDASSAAEPEREWVAKLTDFGLSTAVGAGGTSTNKQQQSGGSRVGGFTLGGFGSFAGGLSGSGGSVPRLGVFGSLGGARRAPSPSQQKKSPQKQQQQDDDDAELELDWNLRIQSRALVAPQALEAAAAAQAAAAATAHRAPTPPSTPPLPSVGENHGAASSSAAHAPNHGASALQQGAAAHQGPDAAAPTPSYALTSKTGSLLYMAPEIYRGDPYNDKADVFSFGVLLREVLAAYLTGFAMGSAAEIERYAKRVSEGFRPPIDHRWPEPLRDLIGACWHQDPRRRPSMSEVVLRLELVVKDLPLLPRVGKEPPIGGGAGAGADGAAAAGGGGSGDSSSFALAEDGSPGSQGPFGCFGGGGARTGACSIQ
jgi:serine/threonine protein kinase